jgi:gamma-glutamylcyclotransferase (GGCT)/AIG2-like uncharacterized protein YtfP
MSNMVKLFVYGTLRKGERRNSILKGSQFIGYAKAKGFLLYKIEDFPGMVEGDGEVVGEVYEIPESLLKELDWIERVPDLFRRELIEVMLEDGQVVSAYAYIYNGEIEDDDEIISSGDWKKRESTNTVFTKSLENKKETTNQKGGGDMDMTVETKEVYNEIKLLNPKILEFMKKVEEILRKRELEDIFLREFFTKPDEYIINNEKITAEKSFKGIEITGRKVNLYLQVSEYTGKYDTELYDWKFIDLAVIFVFEKRIKTAKGTYYTVKVIFKLDDY